MNSSLCKIKLVYLLTVCSDVARWMAAFSQLTLTNWNVRKTHPNLSLLKRKDYVCQFNDYHNRPKTSGKTASRYKDCQCPATITVKVDHTNLLYNNINKIIITVLESIIRKWIVGIKPVRLWSLDGPYVAMFLLQRGCPSLPPTRTREVIIS